MLSIKEDKNNKSITEVQKPLHFQLQYPISLSNLRIIQKHLVYVIGLSEDMANNDILSKYEYFGQYGTIQKIAVNKSKVYNKSGSSNPNYSAYISYSLYEEASLAILAIDNFQYGEYLLRASYGTTKYCTFFLKGNQCPNKDCLYYHSIANEEDIINKEDMNSSSNVFYQQQKTAMKICNIFSNDTKVKLKFLSSMNKKNIFPTPYSIYQKEIVIKNDLFLKTHYKALSKQSPGTIYSLSKKQSHKKSVETLEDSFQISLNNDTASLFHVKIPKVKSLKDNKLSLVSSSKIDFERIKLPHHKRFTFDCISNCSYSNLFRKHKQSRFNFSRISPDSLNQSNNWEERNENEIEITEETVPNHISDLICMTLSRFSFFKQFNNFNNNETEKLLCNTFCYHQGDSWSQFILDNINNNKVVSN